MSFLKPIQGDRMLIEALIDLAERPHCIPVFRIDLNNAFQERDGFIQFLTSVRIWPSQSWLAVEMKFALNECPCISVQLIMQSYLVGRESYTHDWNYVAVSLPR